MKYEPSIFLFRIVLRFLSEFYSKSITTMDPEIMKCPVGLAWLNESNICKIAVVSSRMKKDIFPWPLPSPTDSLPK